MKTNTKKEEHLTFRCEFEIKQELVDLSIERNCSVGRLVRIAIETYLRNEKAELFRRTY